MAGEYQVIVSKEAEEDIDEILHYLLVTYSRDAAVDANQAIQEAIQRLGKMPEAHPPYTLCKK